MGSFDTSKSPQVADSIHEALSTKGDANLHQEKYKAAQKLLSEAAHGTSKDSNAQKQVVKDINAKIKADGLHAEGYGSNGGNSYLILRPLNYGYAKKANSIYYCTISSDGKFSAQEMKHGKTQDKSKPQDQHSKKPQDQQGKQPESKPGNDPYDYNQGRKAPDQQKGQKPQDQPQGQKPQDQPQAQKPQDQTQGQKPQDQPQGRKPQDQPQGQKPQDQPQGQRPQDQPQGHKPQDQPQGQRSQDHPQGQKPQDQPQGQRPQDQQKAAGPAPAAGLFEGWKKADEVSRASQASKAEAFSQSINQSNYFGQQHEVSGKIRDGFRDGGKGSVFNESGELTSPAQRHITVVDRTNDVVLNKTIAEARQRFGNLPPQEKAAALTNYVHDIMSPANMNEGQLDAWYDGFSQAHRGQTVKLGEFIKQGKGVCSQQATLLKVLGDELGLDVRLVRGTGVAGDPALNHAWVDMQMPGQSERVVWDPRQMMAGNYENVPAHERGAKVVNGESEIPVEPHANEPNPHQAVPSEGDRIPAFLKNPTVAKGVNGTLGVIGVGAGVYQTYQGWQMISRGDTGTGSLTMVSGAANTGSGVLGLATLRNAAPAWMGPAAMKLGGAGTVIGGGLEIYNGFKTGDKFQIAEGSMYTTTGGLMFAGGPVGLGAAVFAGSYGATRFVMENTGGDKAVTGAMDAVWNSDANKTAAKITEQNLSNLQNKGDRIIGKSYEQIKASNLTATDVSQVILGLHEKMEKQTGDELNATKAEVVRLINIRTQLAKAS